MVQRLRAIVRSTPGRLTAAMAVLLVAGIAYGATAFTGSAQAKSHVASVRTSSGPLTVTAQSLYRSLSDADATAAAAFLSAGADPPALRQRYLDDIASAGSSLAQISSGTAGSGAALNTLATQLPVYTGLIETARANNRLGYPVGSAYLREASSLMRATLLPAANDVYLAQTQRLKRDHNGGDGYPYVSVVLGVVVLAGLVIAQRYVSRRTRRLVNPGLAAATLLVLAALIYQNAAWVNLHSHLHSAEANGSGQVELLAQARIAALQARADEALTLVARGSGGAFEQDFTTTMHRLVGVDGNGGLLATAASEATDPAVREDVDVAVANVHAWQQVHTTLRAHDDSGKYTAAVSEAIGTAPADASSRFAAIDGVLGDGIRVTDATFSDEATAAAGAAEAVGIVVIILTLLTLAGVAIGVQRRIAEYR